LLLLRDEPVIEALDIDARDFSQAARLLCVWFKPLSGATGDAFPAAPRAANFEEFYECKASG
jgi:hypothetical protein